MYQHACGYQLFPQFKSILNQHYWIWKKQLLGSPSSPKKEEKITYGFLGFPARFSWVASWEEVIYHVDMFRRTPQYIMRFHVVGGIWGVVAHKFQVWRKERSSKPCQKKNADIETQHNTARNLHGTIMYTVWIFNYFHICSNITWNIWIGSWNCCWSMVRPRTICVMQDHDTWVFDSY